MVHELQQRHVSAARTRVAAETAAPDAVQMLATVANAYLLARDQILASMSERARRLTYGRCLGVTQRELAEAEGITQPAVSQLLATSGAPALIEGFRLLRG
jgi:hypothetical protein